MPFSRPRGAGDGAAGGGRRGLLLEIERLATELVGPSGSLEEALAGLVGGDGAPAGLTAEALFEGGVPRIRPVLVSLAARTAAEREGVQPDGTHDVVAIAELLDVSIRLHDAALGRRDGRRRRAARRVLRGATHWLGASHVTLRAVELARRAPAPDVLNEALDALRELAEGHALDDALRARRASPADVLAHHEAHAGTIFAFACRAGGRLAGAPRPSLTGLGRYGRNIGVAWQLAEDLALFERGGAALSRQASEGRPIFPIAHAAERDPQVDVLWRALAARDDAPLAEDLAARVRAAGGLGAGREALVARTWAARQALAALPQTAARDALDRLAAGLARAA